MKLNFRIGDPVLDSDLSTMFSEAQIAWGGEAEFN